MDQGIIKLNINRKIPLRISDVRRREKGMHGWCVKFPFPMAQGIITLNVSN